MASNNSVTLMGNLTRDPELVEVGKDSIPKAEFGLAVDRLGSKSDATDYIGVVCWRKQAKNVTRYKSKGDQVLIEGRLQFSSWEAADGSRRSKVDVVAETVQFLGSNGSPANSTGGQQRAA